ncbi:MAG: hypothetical protein IT437_12115 [Phycisphaerales bacterium]|nr:hypothetical protein [Phycisphaerales bacterium]
MPRSTARDLVLLTLLCGVTYFTGPTTQGLVNWQEAQRAEVAREMQQRGDWIVPRESGRPYLSKPPAVYWTQLALASLRGAKTSELDLRLTVALGGWLGVVATYLVTRRLLTPVAADAAPEAAAWARDAAWWSSLLLATGLLYVRSSRIGELDILLIAPTLVVIGAVHSAWRSFLVGARTRWTAVALATLAACAAMLVKGPPGLLVAALASYGGIALWAAFQSGEPRPSADPVRLAPGSRAARFGALAGAAALAATAAILAEQPRISLDGVTGLMTFAAIGAGAGAAAVRLARPARTAALFMAYSRTHPLLVLGAPLAVLAGWFWLVAQRLGGWEAVRGTIAGEAGDNVRPLVLASPLNNLEAASYGAGLGSIAALAAVIWLWRRRPALPIGCWMVIAWVVLGMSAMSLFGKGVPRYLTPVWPGIAIAGGAWLAWKLRSLDRPWRLRTPALAMVLALAAGQAWWYGYARAHPPPLLIRLTGTLPSPSPREFLAALLARPGVERGRVGTFEFDTAQVDYYVGARTPAYVDDPPRPGIAIIRPRRIADLAARLARERGSFVLLVRRTQPGFLDATPAMERLAPLFHVTPIEVGPRYTIDNGRTEVMALRLGPR